MAPRRHARTDHGEHGQGQAPQPHPGSTADPQERAVATQPAPPAAAPAYPELPPALVDELGRILGAALVFSYQQDTNATGKTGRGFTHTREDRE